MRRFPPARPIGVALMLAGLGFGSPPDAAAQVRKPAAPDNAQPTRSGGSECGLGFRAADGAWVAVTIPAYGRGWACERGDRAADAAWVAIPVPENAYLAISGVDRHCERGFRAEGDARVAIVLPAWTHLEYSGNDRTCAPPSRRRDDDCVRR